MTRPLVRPPRKNPVLRTRLPNLPPGTRSRVALGLTAAAARGRFELQVCRDCGTVQYPPREACRVCLSHRLDWRPQDGGGELVSETLLHHSNELFYRERMPWRLGLVKLDCGPLIVAHLHGDCAAAPSRVRVSLNLDRAGQAALVALPEKDTPNMADDRQLREMTCDPKFRKILITDAKTPLGQALVEAVVAAGADLVWAGHAEPWKKPPGFERLASIPQVSLVPLDLTNSRAVKDLAGEIGGRVDILINTADYHRNFGIASRDGIETARAEMDMNYFGMLRLAQEFAPAMRARGADGQSSAIAWVNFCRCSRWRIFRRTAPIRPRKRRRCRLPNVCAPSCRPRACASSMSFRGRSTTSGIRPCRRRKSPLPGLPPTLLRLCAAASRMRFPATSPRTGSPAGATIRRRWSASLRRSRFKVWR